MSTQISLAGDDDQLRQRRGDAEKYNRAWPFEIRERLDSIRSDWDPTGLFAYGPAAG